MHALIKTVCLLIVSWRTLFLRISFVESHNILPKLHLSDFQSWRRYLKQRPSHYKWKIFSTAVLTLNFDFDLSTNERTNPQTNKHAWSQYLLADVKLKSSSKQAISVSVEFVCAVTDIIYTKLVWVKGQGWRSRLTSCQVGGIIIYAKCHVKNLTNEESASFLDNTTMRDDASRPPIWLIIRLSILYTSAKNSFTLQRENVIV